MQRRTHQSGSSISIQPCCGGCSRDLSKTAEKQTAQSAAVERQRQRQRQDKQLQLCTEAAGSVDEVCRIMIVTGREKGWSTGGQGKLLVALMKRAILEMGQPVGGSAKAGDLVVSTVEDTPLVQQRQGVVCGRPCPCAAFPGPTSSAINLADTG